ncbi:glycosyltransferase [Alicyclobacillaceae bacterium I2511]|nr:glycosyltransferase [Alicyclobacillaceae bacterium I2511]
MIVRNEAGSLPRCLESLRGVADELVVVDTGSTDDTVAIARGFGAVCDTVTWQADFAQARNVSLSHASKDYILVLDADEVLEPEAAAKISTCLRDFPQADGFLVHILNETDGEGVRDVEESVSVRLFRNRPHYRFHGALHEQIAESILNTNPPGVIYDCPLHIQHWGYTQALVKQQGKQVRNLRLAEAEWKAHPKDAFRAYNLGVEYLRNRRVGDAVVVLAVAQQEIVSEALWASRFYKIYCTALMQQGSWPEAQKQLQFALSLYPDYTDLYYLLGVLRSQQQDFVGALAALAQCIQMGDPPVPPYTVEKGLASYRAYFAMGQVFQQLGKTAEAVAAYREAFSQNPSFTEAFLRFGELLLLSDGSPETLAYLTGVAQLAPGQEAVLLGGALVLAGRFGLAQTYLESTLDTREAAFFRALTYACTGQEAKLQQVMDRWDGDGSFHVLVEDHLARAGMAAVQAGLRRYPDEKVWQSLAAQFNRWLP